MNYLIKFSLALIFLTGISACRTNAQTVDLSTKEAVLEELGKQKKSDLSKAKICVERLEESAKVIIIGFFRNDYGCHLDGAFVNSVYIEDGADLSQKALDALGWEKANQERREQLAVAWVEKGLLAFSTVLYTKDKDFGNGEFQPPNVVSKDNGEVVVTLWTRTMRRKKEFHQLEYRFAKDGSLSGN